MKIHYLILALAMIMPGILIPMEKELAKKRPAEDTLEHKVTKVLRLDIDPLDVQEETMQDPITSLPTPPIAAISQQTSASLLASILSSFDEKPFKCDHAGCNFATAYKTSLSGHKKIHTGEKPFRCDYAGCNYAATQKNHLTYHIKTHTDEKPFKCDHAGCNYAAADKSNLATHKRIHTGMDQSNIGMSKISYKCPAKDCAQAFQSKRELNQHMQYHSDETPFSCQEPDCVFFAKTNRDIIFHMQQKHKIMIHSGENPFKCDYEGCDFAAAHSNTLSDHKRTHTGEKPFTCDYIGCNYATKYKSNLANHKKTHTDAKPFTCDYAGCNYAAKTKKSLTNHMKNKHTIITQDSNVSLPTPLIAALNQETPISTPQLTPTSTPFYSTLFDETEIFMEKNQSSKRPAEDILEHEVTKVSRDDLQEETMQDSLVSLPTPLIATISQETPGTPYAPLSSLNDKKSFRCDHAGCNYAAVKKHHLTDHKRTHTDEKPYKCDYVGCDYAAAQKSNLTRHKRVHSKNSDIVSLSTPLIAALNQVRPVSTPLPDIFNNQEEDIMEEKS